MPSLFTLFTTLLSISHFATAAVLIPREETCNAEVFCRGSFTSPDKVVWALDLDRTIFASSDPIVRCYYNKPGGQSLPCFYKIQKRKLHKGYKTRFLVEDSETYGTAGKSDCPKGKFIVPNTECELPSTMSQGKSKASKSKNKSKDSN